MRESWTDERLDDGFERVRSEIAVQRGEIGSLRKELGSLRDEMHSEFGSLRTEMHQGFHSLQRTLLQLCGGIIVALIGLAATLLGLVVTQL